MWDAFPSNRQVVCFIPNIFQFTCASDDLNYHYSYNITYGARGDNSKTFYKDIRNIQDKYEETLTNLEMCTDYEFNVAFVSIQDELGPIVWGK